MARKKRKARRRAAKKPSRRRVITEDLYRVGQFFAAVFIVLLVAAAIVLAKGDERDANQLAEGAYYALVISVVSLLAATALEEREEGVEDGRRSQVAQEESAEAKRH